MAGLLDVNVLVALLVPTHEHHALARQWVVSRDASEGWEVTDRYLLGLARRYGGRVVTCDHGLAVAGGDAVINLPDQAAGE